MDYLKGPYFNVLGAEHLVPRQQQSRNVDEQATTDVDAVDVSIPSNGGKDCERGSDLKTLNCVSKDDIAPLTFKPPNMMMLLLQFLVGTAQVTKYTWAAVWQVDLALQSRIPYHCDFTMLVYISPTDPLALLYLPPDR